MAGKGLVVETKRTASNLEAAAGDACLEVVKGIKRGQYLHGTDGIQHVCIVAGGGPEAAVFMQACEHKF
jgi:hypothetical protein